MSSNVRSRGQMAAAATCLLVAIAAFAVTMATGSVRWLAVGCLGATLSVVAFLWFATARYARLIAFWQADVDAVENNAPRPDVADLVPEPRSTRESPLNDEQARRG